MPEYDVSFSKKLADVAVGLVEQGLESPEARRTVIYLSRLSMEISLKALLERAGKPLSEIRKRSHNLQDLLSDVEQFEFEVESGSGHCQWCSGSKVRSFSVPYSIHRIDMGTIIEAEKYGASKFPERIRYGENVQDVAPEILAPAASILSSWVLRHKGGTRSMA
jgi:hypothetical protein